MAAADFDPYDFEAREGDQFDLVVDVRPESARASNPYPAPCLQIYADDLVDWIEEGQAIDGHEAASCRVCCVCWSGMRAIRCAFILRALGWDAWWWGLSPARRNARKV